MTKGKKILLIEDDEDDQLFFNFAINKIDPTIDCLVARNCEKALVLLNCLDRLPDLIFMDLNMPILDGFDCLREIRNEPSFKTIPIIIFSIYNSPKDTQVAKKKEPNGYLPKPNQMEELKHSLTEILDCNLKNGTDQKYLFV